jgi:malate dehydrogenase (oxaloacetate-decarboxylating)
MGVRKSTDYRKHTERVIRTLRLVIKNKPGNLAKIAKVIGDAGVVIGDVTRLRVDPNYIVRDVTVMARAENIIDPLVGEIESLPGVRVTDVLTDALEVRRGGLLGTATRAEVSSLEDFHKVIMPGVYEACEHLARTPEDVEVFTGKQHMVAIASNGTLMPGARQETPEACLPLLEAKGLVLHQLSGLNAVPLVVALDEYYGFVNIITHIARTFGALMLTGIAPPNCLQIEQRLKDALPIPVFHDDGNGVATAVLGVLIAALERVRKEAGDVSVCIGGCGVAGPAIARLLGAYGFQDMVVVDRKGALYKGRKCDEGTYKAELGRATNTFFQKGNLRDVIKSKDVFVGVSKAGALTKNMIKSMAGNPIILALSIPQAEIEPHEAYKAGAAVAVDAHTCATALSYPGILAGAIAAKTKDITDEMMIAASGALAACAKDIGEVVPPMFDTSVHQAVCKAVRDAAIK